MGAVYYLKLQLKDFFRNKHGLKLDICRKTIDRSEYLALLKKWGLH